MFRSLLKWLGLDRTVARVGLRPHRELTLALDRERAYARCRDAVERTLGATPAIDDPRSGFIEAAFGLVNSERIRISLDSIDAANTHVLIEAIYPASTIPPVRSSAVDALAQALA